MKSKFSSGVRLFKQTPGAYVGLASGINFRQASTLCFVGGPSMQSAALTLREQPTLKSKEFFVVSSPTWIEKAHSDWDSLYWGQPLLYLPLPGKVIAKMLYPRYSETVRMTYGMVKNIYKALRGSVQERGITLIENHVDLIKLSKEGLSVHSGDDTRILAAHDNVHIINAARGLQDGYPMPVRSYGECYSLSREEAANKQYMVVIGSGLNLNWAVRDFPNLQIIHLIPKGDQERPDLLHSLYASMHMENIKVKPCLQDFLMITGVDLKHSAEINVLVPASQVYSATVFF